MDTRFYKVLILINALIPLGLLSLDWYSGSLGANPVEFFLRTTGILTLVFLLISLAVTPLRKYFGWNQLIRYRRLLGLIAFFYGCVHLTTYSIFDKSLDISEIAADVWKRPFIAFGMTAFLILVPLAATSTNGMLKRLGGKKWQRLHRTVYAATVFGVIHFFMIQKSDFRYPIIFGAVLAVLLGYRIFLRFRTSAPARANQKPA